MRGGWDGRGEEEGALLCSAGLVSGAYSAWARQQQLPAVGGVAGGMILPHVWEGVGPKVGLLLRLEMLSGATEDPPAPASDDRRESTFPPSCPDLKDPIPPNPPPSSLLCVEGLGPVFVAALISGLGRTAALNLAAAGWLPCGALILLAAFSVERDEEAVQARLRQSIARMAEEGVWAWVGEQSGPRGV